MYLVAIHVPIYRRGEERLLASDWLRSLELLRDFVAERFGGLVVVAPSLPADSASGKSLEVVDEARDRILLVPSIDARCSSRSYWFRQRRVWRRDLRRLVSRADVVHAGLDDVYRPLSYDGFLEGVRQGKPTVFVQDTDIVGQRRELARGQSRGRRLVTGVYTAIYEHWCRRGVALADLSLLKGRQLLRRYADAGGNLKAFQDTSVREQEILSREQLDRRLAQRSSRRSLALVYCGRLVPGKGVLESLDLVRDAVREGYDLRFDVIGDGPLLPELRRRVQEQGLAPRVCVHGPVPYGPELIQRLARHDALLYTPLAEDTPRMIFDGYAAGLPLVGHDIPYVKERAAQDRAVWLLPRHDRAAALRRLVELTRSPVLLASLSVAALQAAHHHCAENWYRRRARWTVEAVRRRQAAGV